MYKYPRLNYESRLSKKRLVNAINLLTQKRSAAVAPETVFCRQISPKINLTDGPGNVCVLWSAVSHSSKKDFQNNLFIVSVIIIVLGVTHLPKNRQERQETDTTHDKPSWRWIWLSASFLLFSRCCDTVTVNLFGHYNAEVTPRLHDSWIQTRWCSLVWWF